MLALDNLLNMEALVSTHTDDDTGPIFDIALIELKE